MTFPFGLLFRGAPSMSLESAKTVSESIVPAGHAAHRRHRRVRRLMRRMFRDPVVGACILGTVLLFLWVLSAGIYRAMALDK